MFFALKYVSSGQLGWIESISFLIGWLLEIPSGAVADLLGKKRTLQLSFVMLVIGSIIFTLGHLSPWLIAIGNMLIIGSFAFKSGSIEALAYDSMVEQKKEADFETVISRGALITPLVFSIVSIIGGFAWTIHNSLPWILSIICFTIALAISSQLTEPSVDTYKFSWKQFVDQQKVGFAQLFSQKLRPYFFLFLGISMTYYAWNAGIVRIFMGADFGFDGESLSYLIGVLMIASSIALHQFTRIKNALGTYRGLVYLTALAGAAWIVAGLTSNMAVGVVVILVLSITGSLHTPWVSVVLNRSVPSAIRATTISTLQFFVQIPYIFVAALFGGLVDQDLQWIFYIVSGVVLFLMLIPTLVRWIRVKSLAPTRTATPRTKR